MKAAQLAQYLRVVAEGLEREPEAEVGSWYLQQSGMDQNKETFVAAARVMPRPVEKNFGEVYIELKHQFNVDPKNTYHDFLQVFAQIRREDVCEVVEPAKPAVYRCDPLLLPEEEAAL